ncbi:MAG: NAD-dependent epimerase/dehydratase family protein [Candidatus Eremiobacteraeota bacterium]|nr:NAD-dependent epimerase/dehydratase family protein [Candidatus Eremiobacteraeota bacterium]
MGRIALIGATGAVGQAIAAVLREQGRAYRVVGRSETSLQKTFGADSLAEIRTWNADAESARAALEGVESAIYLVGVPYDHFELHPQLMRATLEGAIAAGVKRLLLIGTVYPYGLPRTGTVDESHPRDPHAFNGKMRKEQEDLLLAAHGAGIETCVLRFPDLYGPGMEKSYLTGQFANAPQGKRSTMIGPVDVRHEWAFIPDCARVAVRVLDEPRAYGMFWNYAGPGEITEREFSDKIYAACGKKPNYLVVNKTVLQLFGLFNPEMRKFAEMNYLMSDPVIMNDGRLRSLLGELPKTSYDEGIRLTLEGQAKMAASHGA